MQTKIYKNTFKGCSKLKNITLPSSISAIDDRAFLNCSSLTDANIGLSVKFIGLSAFLGAISLSNVDRFSDNNPAHTFDMVGNYAFENTGLKTVNLALRSDVINTFWGDNCFANCKNLETVNILSANYLSKCMFKNCEKLKNVSFNVNMMAYMYPNAFEHCIALRNITLPSKALYIPEEMFKNCTNLENIKFTNYDAENSGVELILKNAFTGCLKLNEIHIPASINKLDLIEDAALSSIKCSRIKFYGIHHDLFGIYVKPLDIQCAIPYYLNHIDMLVDRRQSIIHHTPDISDIIWVLKYAAYYNMPVVLTIEFFYKYWPNCNEFKCLSCTTLTKDEYTSPTVPIKNTWPGINLKGLNTTFKNNSNKEILYDFSNKKYIILPIHICIGSILDGYDSSKIFNSSIQNQLKSYLNNTWNNRLNPDYNLLTKLYSMNEIFDMVTIQNNIKTSNYKMYACVIKTWNTDCIGNMNKINSLSCISDAIIDKTSGRYYKFTDLNNNLNEFLSLINNFIYNSFEYNSIIQENATQYNKLSLSFMPNDTIKSNALFRYITPTNSSINITASDNTSFNIIRNKPESWRILPYSEPTHYATDKTTVNGFTVGKWYYKARELYEYVRRNNKPCLFIYSMLGCGPCQIYSKHIWNNSSFLAWVLKLKFYLCGIECESQPFYDESLLFVSDLSKTAKNFTNNSTGTVLPNAFGETFARIMTPVLIFMDKNGNCYDYTYHSLLNLINMWGVDKVIKCLKSLCLYHFDNNVISTTGFVNDATPFILGDYKTLDIYNKWKIADNMYALDKSGLNSIEDVNTDIILLLEKAGVTSGLYLGGCIINDIDYFDAIFGSNHDVINAETAEQYNTAFLNATFRVGDKFYKLTVDSTDYKRVRDMCSDGTSYVYIYKIVWQECD